MLGRMCPDPAGELGALELGELLCEELVPGGRKQNAVSTGYLPSPSHPPAQTASGRGEAKVSELSQHPTLMNERFLDQPPYTEF